MSLTPREVAILEVLAREGEEQKRGMYAGRIGALAGFKFSGRRDAGTTRTLDSMGDLVTYDYQPSLGHGWGSGGRRWFITDKGRQALAEFAFGEKP